MRISGGTGSAFRDGMELLDRAAAGPDVALINGRDSL